jgi:ATP-binding cassette subfamily B protein
MKKFHALVSDVSQLKTKPDRSLKSLLIFWPYIIKYPSQLIMLGIAISLATFSVLVFGHALGNFVNEGVKSEKNLFWYQGIFLLFALVSCLALGSYLRLKSITFLGESIVAELKTTLFDRLLHQPYPYFEKKKTGDLLSCLTNDILLIQLLVSNSAPIALRNLMLMLGGICMLFVTNAKLAAYVFLIAPLLVIFISILGKTVKVRSKNMQEIIAHLNTLTEESLYAIREIQAFNQEKIKKNLFHTLSQDIVTYARTYMNAKSRLIISVMIIVFSFIAFLLWQGRQSVIEGNLSPGDLASFVFYALLVASSVNTFSEIITDIQRSAGAADRLKELLFLPLKRDEKPIDTSPIFSSDLVFHSLSFSYPSRPSQEILSALSLRIQKGQICAFVGPSGAGKTTLFHLLLNFYTPKNGDIFLDNVPYSTLSNAAIRSYFSYVPQDPHIFSGTLRENLLFGNPQATDKELDDVLEKAHLTEFINNLKEGLETRVGQKGIRLSGGQKQRMAFARALLRKAPILLLDEPTSALDSQSENFIQNTFQSLKKEGVTIIVIAHRLSTVQQADQIYVIDQGTCVEKGGHETLLKQKGLYADLAKIQFDSYEKLF